MMRSVGRLDRWIRVLLGLGLLALVFVGPQTAWGYLGVVPLFTGLVGWCPLYSLMKWSTHRADSSRPRTA